MLTAAPRHFDPECPHERAHQGLAACLAAADLGERLVGVSGAGCGSLVHAYLDMPFVAAPFGRGPSVARGLLLARPEVVPVVYAGEGELLGEGLADLVRAAQLDVPMLVVMIDNTGRDADLLEGLGTKGAEVTEVEPEAVREAFAWGLGRVTRDRRFALVRVRGGCPLAGEESGCRR